MKKLCSILILCCILFTLCSCNFRRSDDKNNAVTDNIPLAEYRKLPSYELVEAKHYKTMEQLLDDLEPTTSIVIKGKMTGETRQSVPYDDGYSHDGSGFTDIKIKVLDIYYGDVNVGDEIVLRQDYYTYENKDGNPETVNFACVPLDRESEYLLVLHGYNESIYEGVTAFTSIDRYRSELDLSLLNYSGLYKELYNKYIQNEDTALDKANEAKKLLERKQMLAERYVYAKSQFKNKRIYKQVTKLLEQYPCSYDVLKSGLSDSERDLIERLVQKYGEK